LSVGEGFSPKVVLLSGHSTVRAIHFVCALVGTKRQNPLALEVFWVLSGPVARQFFVSPYRARRSAMVELRQTRVAATLWNRFVRARLASALESSRESENVIDKMSFYFVSYCRFSRKYSADFTTEGTEGTERKHEEH
jgi:hypothetical protein